jgi:hypothetical protein
MSKISEQKALEEYPEDLRVLPFGQNPQDINVNKRTYYQKGYDQAMQDFLDKACEWLKGNSKKYVVCYEDGYSHYAYNSMIEDFKNYMQDEM